VWKKMYLGNGAYLCLPIITLDVPTQVNSLLSLICTLLRRIYICIYKYKYGVPIYIWVQLASEACFVFPLSRFSFLRIAAKFT
jgi:hypothetical protein